MASRSVSVSVLAAVLCAAASPSLADDTALFEQSATGAWVRTTPLVSPMPWNFSVNELGALGAAQWPGEGALALGALDAAIWPADRAEGHDIAADVRAEDQPRVFARVAGGEWDVVRRAPASAPWNFSVDSLGAIGAAAWASPARDAFVEAAPAAAPGFASVYDAGWKDVFGADRDLSLAQQARFSAVFDAYWVVREPSPLTPATAYAPFLGRGGATPAIAYAPFLGRGGATPATAYAPFFGRGGATPATAYAPFLGRGGATPATAYAPSAPRLARAGSEPRPRLDLSFGDLHLGAIFRNGWMSGEIEGETLSSGVEPISPPDWGALFGIRGSEHIGTSTIPPEMPGPNLIPTAPRESEWGLD